MTEERDRVKYRVYYAAKDGMSISLYTLLSEIDKIEANQLINEVNIIVIYVLAFLTFASLFPNRQLSCHAFVL